MDNNTWEGVSKLEVIRLLEHQEDRLEALVKLVREEFIDCRNSNGPGLCYQCRDSFNEWVTDE